MPAERFCLPGTDRQDALLRYVRRVLVDREKRSLHGALKMDKWDEAVNRIKQGMLAEEPEAALAGALEMFANFGRCLELISADTDRIATALEKGQVEISGDDTSELDYHPPEEPVHDL